MKFKFNLQKLLEYRKIKEDLAQKEYLEVSAELIDQENILQVMYDDLKQARALAGAQQSQGGATLPGLVQIAHFTEGQMIRIQIQQKKVEDLKQLVETKREILRTATLEYKIIDKIKEKKWQEYLEENRKTEQKESDELTLLRMR